MLRIFIYFQTLFLHYDLCYYITFDTLCKVVCVKTALKKRRTAGIFFSDEKKSRKKLPAVKIPGKTYLTSKILIFSGATETSLSIMSFMEAASPASSPSVLSTTFAFVPSRYTTQSS